MLLTVGRLDAAERSKGFDEVLDVLGDLPEDVVYMIAGGGNDAPRLQRGARSSAWPRASIFTGLFADEEKPDLYNLADVYVMPSRGEGFGFVFLEAMACGVPAIASKLDGGREALLDGKLGMLVDPTNPAEIRAAILETLARGGGACRRSSSTFRSRTSRSAAARSVRRRGAESPDRSRATRAVFVAAPRGAPSPQLSPAAARCQRCRSGR